MSAKVIQGSFLTGQPRWSPSVQPKNAPSPFHPKTVAPPPTVFGPRPPQSPAPAHAAQPTASQRHAAGGAFAVEAGPLGLVSGSGKPLPDAVRGKMENALGADFSGVRVHVGPQAERIGAIAFTTGTDIYFAPGRYQPETIQGQQLLGHELAHVVQQRAGRVRNPLGSGLAVVQDRALEAEADRLGQRAATHRVAVQPKMPPGTAQPSAPVRISPPVSAGRGSYRLSAGAGGREIGSVMVHARDRGAVEVTDLGVDAAQRGNGVGQMLVAAAARTGLQSGQSKVTLAAQDRGSGHLTRWYKEMGFTQVGINQRGYPQLEAPISRVLAGSAQRREAPSGKHNSLAPPLSAAQILSSGSHFGCAQKAVAQLARQTRSYTRNNPVVIAGLQIQFAGQIIDIATYVLGSRGDEFDDFLFGSLEWQYLDKGLHPSDSHPLNPTEYQTVKSLYAAYSRRQQQKKPTARETFRYQNPSHTSTVGLDMLAAGAHTPYDSSRWASEKDWLTSPNRNYVTYSPNSRNMDLTPTGNHAQYTQGHSNVVFGHDMGASVHFNQYGHKMTPDEIYQWNQQPTVYHNLENRHKSNKSGGSSARYQQPSSARGSHRMYWDPTHPDYSDKYKAPWG